jgi:hypothetical protein
MPCALRPLPYAFLLLCLALPPTHPFFPALRNSQSAIRNCLAPFALCLSFTLLGPTTAPLRAYHLNTAHAIASPIPVAQKRTTSPG